MLILDIFYAVEVYKHEPGLAGPKKTRASWAGPISIMYVLNKCFHIFVICTFKVL